MSVATSTLVDASGRSKRSCDVRVRVLSRPDNVADWAEYYDLIAHDYAFRHHAHVTSPVILHPDPFRESGYITFTMKRWKKPKAHAGLTDFLRGRTGG